MESLETTETSPRWLADHDLQWVRDKVPLVYVEAVPVRLDHLGHVQKVGLLLRVRPDGSVSRTIIGGRVLHGETVREALWRHLAKDLGPEAEPDLPPCPSPFTIAEYFPDPRRTGYHDPRQHAVSLVYVVPVEGDCRPSQDALELSWLSVEEASGPFVAEEMSSGHDRLVRLAMAHVGRLP